MSLRIDSPSAAGRKFTDKKLGKDRDPASGEEQPQDFSGPPNEPFGTGFGSGQGVVFPQPSASAGSFNAAEKAVFPQVGESIAAESGIVDAQRGSVGNPPGFPNIGFGQLGGEKELDVETTLRNHGWNLESADDALKNAAYLHEKLTAAEKELGGPVVRNDIYWPRTGQYFVKVTREPVTMDDMPEDIRGYLTELENSRRTGTPNEPYALIKYMYHNGKRLELEDEGETQKVLNGLKKRNEWLNRPWYVKLLGYVLD